MPLYHSPAIVMHSFNYGESDKIVTFLTKDFGKLRGIAKGARRSKKRFQNALELFTHLKLIFFDREGMGLVRAQGCDLLDSFPRVRENLTKILYGNYFLEMVNEMAGEREPHLDVFDLLLSFLKMLDSAEPREDHLRVFEIRVLSLFGYRPDLTCCSLCRRDWEALQENPSVFFSIEKGTLQCSHCSHPADERVPLSLGTARLIEGISDSEISRVHRFRFTPQALLESRALLPRFIAYQLGKELKSLKALGTIAQSLVTVEQDNG
jgi:DNA repair protein RecO (recombination protein O)